MTAGPVCGPTLPAAGGDWGSDRPFPVGRWGEGKGLNALWTNACVPDGDDTLQELLLSPALVVRCIVGFAVGALIGLERQKRLTDEGAIGVRSFGLHSLFGMLAAYSYNISGNFLLLAYAVMVSGTIVALQTAYKMFRSMRKGLTTPVVFALSFVLGALVGLDTPAPDQLIGPLQVLSMTVAFLVFLVLGFKEELAAAVRVITKEEMISAAELAVLILFLWPLMPGTVQIGPIDFPVFQTYALIVLLMAISFGNYILVKKFKDRGVYFFAFFGGFANSEATVSSLTDFHVRTDRKRPGQMSVATIFANIAMVLRNGVIVILVDPSLLVFTFYLIPLAILTVLGMARMLRERSEEVGESDEPVDTRLVSPFEFGAAMRFAFVFTVISFISLVLQDAFDSLGMILAAVFGGFASAGAISFIACSAFVAGNITLSTAVFAITISTTTAVLNKIVYVYASDREMTLLRRVTKDSLIMAAGAVVYLIVLAMGMIPMP